MKQVFGLIYVVILLVGIILLANHIKGQEDAKRLAVQPTMQSTSGEGTVNK